MRLMLAALATAVLACSPGAGNPVAGSGSDTDAGDVDASRNGATGRPVRLEGNLAVDAGDVDAAGGTCGGTIGGCPVPVDAGVPFEWPAPVPRPPTTFAAGGWTLAIAYGQDTVAVATWISGGTQIITFGQDPPIFYYAPIYAPMLAATSRSTFAYVDPQQPPLRESGTNHALALPLPRVPRPIVGEPAGGFLFAVQEPDGRILLERATPDWTLDPAFGGNGSVVLPGVPSLALAQGTVAPSVVNLLVGDELHRIDGVTGALLGPPIPVPHVPIGNPEVAVVPGPVLALAPLSNGGVALVQDAEGDALVLHRYDAAGVQAPPQVVSFAADPVEAAADPSGRVTVLFPHVDDVVRLARIDAHTGALDPGFGVGGHLVLAGGNASGTDWRWRWNEFGVLRDGRAVIGGIYETHNENGWVATNLFYALPD